MQTLARLIVRKPIAWVTVALVLVIAIASLFGATRVKHDDDVLAFLPSTNPEVRLFYDVNKRFGGLDVAVVGIGAPDVFAPDFLKRLSQVTKRLNETEGVAFALSLTSVEDFIQDTQKGGISVGYLVSDVPEGAEALAALRQKVMSRDQIVGNLVSTDGRAAQIYCFGAYGADPKAMAKRVRGAVEQAFPGEAKFWAGAPFISTYIYDVTQEDIRKLAPWAVLLIVLITVISFRDVIGSAIVLLSTAVGIVATLGLMGALGVNSNIILGSMPVILFALGSAYSVHILSRYYTVIRDRDCEGAITTTICEVGPTVIASGLATMVGLLSFLCMDIEPMRTFGLFTAIGILATLLLSLTFVPAVIRLTQLKGRSTSSTVPTRFMARVCAFAAGHRLPVGVAFGVIAAAGALLIGRLESRMDNAAFFSKGSPPDQAEAFLGEHFGGSQFIQLQVQGDMNDPHVLREVQALADRIDLVPGVTSVTHVAAVVAQINEAMEGDRRVPDTADKVKLLYRFLAGNRAVTQVVSDDRKFALVQIKVSSRNPSEVDEVLAQVETIARTQAIARYVVADVRGPRQEEARARLHDRVLARIQATSKLFSVPLTGAPVADVRKRLSEGPAQPDPAPIKAALVAYLASEEFSGELPETPVDAASRVAEALAGLGPNASSERIAGVLAGALEREPGDAVVTDLADSLSRPLEEIRKRKEAATRAADLVRASALAKPEGAKGERYLTAVANALMDLQDAAVLLPASPTEASAVAAPEAESASFEIQATGLPVLHQGLSRSVARNQIKSLVFALGLVLLLMVILYRSLWSGLLVMSPILVTLLIVYGGMGLLGVHLDIGTSMLASLIIGAGVDYAVHLAAGWSAPPDRPLTEAAAAAATRTGPSIWLNALMVAAGFMMLTLGEARPLQNVGGLTSAAMLIAALATFLVMPALARKHRYSYPARIPESLPPSETEAAVANSSPP